MLATCQVTRVCATPLSSIVASSFWARLSCIAASRRITAMTEALNRRSWRHAFILPRLAHSGVRLKPVVRATAAARHCVAILQRISDAVPFSAPTRIVSFRDSNSSTAIANGPPWFPEPEVGGEDELLGSWLTGAAIQRRPCGPWRDTLASSVATRSARSSTVPMVCLELLMLAIVLEPFFRDCVERRMRGVAGKAGKPLSTATFAGIDVLV